MLCAGPNIIGAQRIFRVNGVSKTGSVWNFSLPTVQGRVLPLWLFNCAWRALVNVVVRLFFCSLAASVLARMRLPNRNLICWIVVASMAFPPEITLIPSDMFYACIGWINTYWPMIIPDIPVPLGIFLLTQPSFYMRIHCMGRSVVS